MGMTIPFRVQGGALQPSSSGFFGSLLQRPGQGAGFAEQPALAELDAPDPSIISASSSRSIVSAMTLAPTKFANSTMDSRKPCSLRILQGARHVGTV